MLILQWSLIFIVSLAVVIKAADYFIDSAEKIGIHFKIPPFIIGVTIIGLGTSLPELATSIIAVLQNHPEIVIGNVVGSNIVNIMLITALSAVIAKHIFIDKEIINIDLPIMLCSSIFIFLTTIDGTFTYIDGTIGLLCLITYITYNIKSHRQIVSPETVEVEKMVREEKREKDHLSIKYPIILVLSLIALYFSAQWTIKSVVELSSIIKIGTEILAVSAVAIGTSLPELVVSVIAAKKGKGDIAIGNITGSNIFNVFAVMGIPSLIGTLSISADMISFGIPALLFITILYMFMTMDKQVTQWEGITLILLYIAFMGKTFGII